MSAIPGLSQGKNTSAKESGSIKFDYFGDFNTPPNPPKTLDDAVKVIKEITNPKNQARAVPVTLYLTPLHRLNLPKKPSTPMIVEMQSRTELAIRAYMDKASRLCEQMDTIKGSTLAERSPKYSNFNLALQGVIKELINEGE